MNNDLVENDISSEAWREYDFGGRVYIIAEPVKLYYRVGGSTHRVVDSSGVAHCLPGPGYRGCVIRWKSKTASPEVSF
jgi:hypothetical protein